MDITYLFYTVLAILFIIISLKQVKNRYANTILLNSSFTYIEKISGFNLNSLRVYMFEIVYLFGLLGVYGGFLLLFNACFAKTIVSLFFLFGFIFIFPKPSIKAIISSSKDSKDNEFESIYLLSIYCGIMLA